jgi:hypothetical protein
VKEITQKAMDLIKILKDHIKKYQDEVRSFFLVQEASFIVGAQVSRFAHECTSIEHNLSHDLNAYRVNCEELDAQLRKCKTQLREVQDIHLMLKVQFESEKNASDEAKAVSQRLHERIKVSTSKHVLIPGSHYE